MTVCTSLGQTFEAVGEALPKDVLGQDVHLVSISFDERDTTEDLKNYGARFEARPDVWRIAKVVNTDHMEKLLKAFEVTVIPAEGGDFEHNAAVLLVDRKNNLAEIVDHTPPEKALEVLWKRL